MSNAAKAHEPTMEEILASIRRIIADDEPAAEAKPAAAAPKPAAPSPAAKAAAAAPEPEAAAELGQDDIDAMLASFDSPAVPAKAEAAPAPKPQEEDVLELTKPVAKPGSEASEDLEFREAVPAAKMPAPEPEPEEDAWATASAMDEEEAAPPPPPKPFPAAIAREVGETLLGQEPGNAVASAFSSLAHTILSQNARTLDDLVQEMLRPMLKSWLDDNLPTIVERLVRAEIERVSRGPRR
jgi:cell pole-organizing protein PopZ